MKEKKAIRFKKKKSIGDYKASYRNWKTIWPSFDTAKRYPGEKMAWTKQDQGRDKGTFNY